jgi:hypothetical protein
MSDITGHSLIAAHVDKHIIIVSHNDDYLLTEENINNAKLTRTALPYTGRATAVIVALLSFAAISSFLPLPCPNIIPQIKAVVTKVVQLQ